MWPPILHQVCCWEVAEPQIGSNVTLYIRICMKIIMPTDYGIFGLPWASSNYKLSLSLKKLFPFTTNGLHCLQPVYIYKLCVTYINQKLMKWGICSISCKLGPKSCRKHYCWSKKIDENCVFCYKRGCISTTVKLVNDMLVPIFLQVGNHVVILPNYISTLL